MGLSDLTSSEAVGEAMDEFDRLGQSAFLERYGFGPATNYLLRRDGKEYPTKAIAGAAHGFQHPALGPLTSDQIRGGRRVVDRLHALGFEILSITPEPKVWLIRGGKLGEAEQLCLADEICGIGWPDLPDLSALDEPERSERIESVYRGDPAGRIANTKVQIRDFLEMRPGDLVLMPLKSQPGLVAVGEIVGEYQHRPDLPKVLNHVRETEWFPDLYSREQLEALSRWLNRPPTVARIPVEAEQILSALSAGRPVSLAGAVDGGSGGEGVLQEVLEETLGHISANEDRAEISTALSIDAPAALRRMVGAGRSITHGVGIGTPADVPWVAIHPDDSDTSAQTGTYAVYLFATEGSAVYLSLIQGTEKLSGGLNPLRKRAEDIRTAAALEVPGDPIDLGKAGGRPARYEAATAFAIRYDAGAVPADTQLRADLEKVLSAADRVASQGLNLRTDLEPLHLLFKWSAQIEAETIARHDAVAAEKGSVWWGKFGTGPGAIGARRRDQIRQQLADGIPTRCYLYGGGTTVVAQLEQLEVDPDQVDEDRLPSYYEKDDCNLFARISRIEPLEPDWPLGHLLLASDPDPAKVQGALANQTTPLFFYERFVPRGESLVTRQILDKSWLGEETLWIEEDLDEVLSALESRGQVILAGPPGTGKTWVAERLARYMTQDEGGRVRTVQMHPSYGYEEFVEGLRPVASSTGGISFKETPGVIKQIAEGAAEDGETHLLIVDEINRANIPRVFGELLYLLEYRDKEIDLQFTPQFSLPRNVKLIATMNTADRSTRSIDVALRRRFDIFECAASADVLERFYESDRNENAVDGLVEGFSKLNHELTTELDRHHTIGQSFFMRQHFAAEDLRRVWSRQILPLIEDYFFDQRDLVDRFDRERFWPGT